MQTHKWDTMQDYGFAFGNIEQNQLPSEEKFKEIIAKIEGFNWFDRNTWEIEKDAQGNPKREGDQNSPFKRIEPQEPQEEEIPTCSSARSFTEREIRGFSRKQQVRLRHPPPWTPPSSC